MRTAIARSRTPDEKQADIDEQKASEAASRGWSPIRSQSLITNLPWVPNPV
jgi:hypothetical protein